MRVRVKHDAEKLFRNPETLLGFMRRTRKPVFHNSNIFFRDVQYAIRDYFDSVEANPISIPQAEKLANDVIDLYVQVGLLRKVGNQAYVLDAPEFSTPQGGTYSMLTIHGAPLPEDAAQSLEKATIGTPADPAMMEEVKQYKGGDVSPEGATIAALTLPIAPPTDAQPGHLTAESDRDPQEAENEIRKGPPMERHVPQDAEREVKAPNPAPVPPWMNKN